MRALVCKNCGAAEWIEEDGYQICTYCKTKIPIESREINYIERKPKTESIVGKWVSLEIGETTTIIVENDLSGSVTVDYPPNTKTAKDLEIDNLGIKGHILKTKWDINIINKGNGYLMIGHNPAIDSHYESFFGSNIKNHYEYRDFGETEVGNIYQISKDSIKFVITGGEIVSLIRIA